MHYLSISKKKKMKVQCLALKRCSSYGKESNGCFSLVIGKVSERGYFVKYWNQDVGVCHITAWFIVFYYAN